jgi:hypothetical protein
VRHCTWCGDETAPVEYNPAPVDPDEPWFCSSECEEKFQEAEDAAQAYESASWPAPAL